VYQGEPPALCYCVSIDMGVFVGRRPELLALAAGLARARSGMPGVVLVEGPAGIGKTALLHQALGGATGVRVLWAGGEELETAVPYGVVTRLMAGVGTVPLDGGPLQVGAALLGALDELQERGPVALVVDDAHWADGSSLAALAFALRRLRADHVLAVLAVRDLADPVLPEGLRRLLSGGNAVRLVLSGLSVPELGSLCTGLGLPALDTGALARLRAHTGGNPLHAGAVLRQTPAEVLTDPLACLPAPGAYARDVLARLAACGEDARALVRAAGVLGESCALRNAERLAGLRDPLDALDEAVLRGLLDHRPAAGDVRIAFPHPLVRAAVYHALGPLQRARAHARAATLETDEATRLRHRMRAGEQGGRLSVDVAAFARGQALDGAWESSAEHFGQACHLAGSARERAALGAEAVHALLQDGQVGRAAEFAARASADGPAGAFMLGAVAQAAGEVERGLALLEEAWRRCDPVAEPGLAGRVATYLSVLTLQQDRAGDALEWSRRALGLAAHLPDAGLLRFYHPVALFLSGRTERALEIAAGLPEPVSTSGDLDALIARGALRTWSDDLEGADRDLRRTLADRPRISVPGRLLANALLSQVEYRLGHWDDALAAGTSVVSIEDDLGSHWLTPYIHPWLALPLAARGDYARARAHIGSGRRHAQGALAGGYLALAEASLATAMGDHQSVVTALAPLAERREAFGSQEPGVIAWQDLLADALVALGRTDDAEDVLIAYEKLAGARGRHSALAGLARAQGNLYAARRRHADARAAFETAREHAALVPMPFEAARADLAYGGFLRRTGHRSDAAALLTRARETLERLRARPYLDRCDQELAACGRAVSRAAQRDQPVLTPQEHIVTRMVLTGMSNRQIAREMVLSVKTVEYHLGNVYAKVGVSSRTALAARLGGS
jgi:DNA-binding CsgD family transcriptional regulator